MWKSSPVSYTAVPSSLEEANEIDHKYNPSLRSRLFRHLRHCILPLTLIIIISIYFLVLHAQNLRITSNAEEDIQTADSEWEKETFIQRVLEIDIDGPLNNTALSSSCNNRDWIPGLIMKCEPPAGGIGNVRNVFLNCIRYAIEAGGRHFFLHEVNHTNNITATSLVVPQIIARSEDKITLQTGSLLSFTYFFDLEFFIESLTFSCPSITILPENSSLILQAQTLDPKTLAPVLLHSKWPEMISPAGWSASFQSYLSATFPTISASNPVLIEIKIPLFQFPFSYNSPAFVASFGRILRFRADVRRIAATVLYGMVAEYELDVSLATGMRPDIYYGAHLRTATDAIAAGWTSYNIQSRNILADTKAHTLSLIYLASGNQVDTERFISTAASQNINVTSKMHILSLTEFEDERLEMEALSWDQQALIDYEVLLRSSVFSGTWESSFAWNVAVRRHLTAEKEVARSRKVMFGDELSTVYGPGTDDDQGWWFKEGMWP